MLRCSKATLNNIMTAKGDDWLHLKVGVGEDVVRVAPTLLGVAGSPLAVRHQEHQGEHQLLSEKITPVL